MNHRLAMLAAGCLFVACITRLNYVDHDMFHEMSLAREIINQGSMPLDNRFAYTPTVFPVVHHEWAMGWLLYGATMSTGWGLAGLTLLRWMLIVATGAAIWATAHRRGASPLIFALGVILVLPFAWVGFGTVRAQLVTLLFTTIQLRLMEEDNRGHRGWVFGVLPLWVLWVNIHAGFLVGVGLMAIDSAARLMTDVATQWQCGRITHGRWLMRRLLRRYAHRVGLGVAAVATLGLTPYGALYAPYVLDAIRLPRHTIGEWGPLWTTYQPTLTMWAFALSVIVTITAMLQIGWRRATGSLVLLVTAYLALKHIRHGSIYGVVWLCYAPALVSRCRLGDSIERFVANRQPWVEKMAIAATLASVCFFCYHGGWYSYLAVNSNLHGCNQPSGAVDYLQRHRFRGRIMTPFAAGAYVMWQMYPHAKISLDGRYEVGYPTELLEEHQTFYGAKPGWQAVIRRYPCDVILIPNEAAILPMLADQGWQRIYEDDTFTLVAPHAQTHDYGNARGQELPQKFIAHPTSSPQPLL